MNSVVLIGNLTRDPDVRYTTSNDPVCVAKFSLAINSGYGDNQRTAYPEIVVFGKQAENCERFLSKGAKVCVSGEIQTGSYEKDGNKIYITNVKANKVEFLSTAKKDEWQMP